MLSFLCVSFCARCQYEKPASNDEMKLREACGLTAEPPTEITDVHTYLLNASLKFPRETIYVKINVNQLCCWWDRMSHFHILLNPPEFQ